MGFVVFGTMAHPNSCDRTPCTLVHRSSGRVLGFCSVEERVIGLGALVGVVDDDESVRESLPDLLRELGYLAKAFGSAEEFLTSGPIPGTRCLILDIAMPGMSGPELQRELIHRGYRIPIIFITALVDKST